MWLLPSSDFSILGKACMPVLSSNIKRAFPVKCKKFRIILDPKDKDRIKTAAHV